MKQMLAILLLACGFETQASAQVVIAREGEGARRTELNGMERTPFKDEWWSQLADWKNGSALTAAESSGKPVLICTWGDWYQPSKRAVSLGTKMAEKYGKDGLIVVLAHHEKGWDTANKPAAPADSTLLVAHDSTGGFRKALKVDQDPDFYLIDRAGQLRYADVQLESIETAVEELVKEQSDAASSLNARLAKEASEKEAARLRAEALAGSLKFTDIPEQTFPIPSAEDFRKAPWPPRPREQNTPPGTDTSTLPPKIITLPDSNWFPSKPTLKGRAFIVYFWSPLFPTTYYEVLPIADRIAREFGRDVIVIGVAMDFDGLTDFKVEGEKDFTKFVERTKTVFESQKLQHYVVAENGRSIYDSITSEQKIYLPFFVVASSNLQARWWPVKGNDDRFVAPVDFMAAVRQVIKADPAIRARQRAEEAYIKSKSK